jgi:hypothetical protein
MKQLDARKKIVALAVASAISGGAVMMSAPAQAMNVSQQNVGEALIFPYYTVQNGFDTLFYITNTSDRTTMFKIRFREARNSRETRDFNVILSPYDMWTGVVSIGGAGVPVVRTYDKSCTAPVLAASPTNAGATEVEFTSLAYDGTDGNPLYAYDKGGKDSARMNEGYFEVIEMAHSTIPETQITSSNLVEYKTQHVSGTPRDCATVATYFDSAANLANGATGSGKFSTFTAPADVLKGHSIFIDVTTGKSLEADPTHIAHFADTSTLIYQPGDLKPSLADGDVVAALGFDSAFGIAPWVAGTAARGDSADLVTQLLTQKYVINEFVADGVNKTDWVVTYPTKHFYADRVLNTGLPNGSVALPPFAENFPYYGYSCDKISLQYWDREEKTKPASSGGFSPAPTGGTVKLCYEVNRITWNNSNVFGPATSTSYNNVLSKSTTDVGTAGWAMLELFDTGDNTFAGLPVIGFAATVREAGGATVNYGSDEVHTYTKLPDERD